MEKKKHVLICSECKSDNVVCDAWAEWNPQTHRMEVADTFDTHFCKECEGECNVEEIPYQN